MSDYVQLGYRWCLSWKPLTTDVAIVHKNQSDFKWMRPLEASFSGAQNRFFENRDGIAGFLRKVP